MELKELRNTMSFAYFLLNAIFVVFIFTMQQNTDQVNKGPEYFLITFPKFKMLIPQFVECQLFYCF